MMGPFISKEFVINIPYKIVRITNTIYSQMEEDLTICNHFCLLHLNTDHGDKIEYII